MAKDLHLAMHCFVDTSASSLEISLLISNGIVDQSNSNKTEYAQKQNNQTVMNKILNYIEIID